MRARRRWPVELGMQPGQNIEWEEVWDTFKIGFATPVDYNTRFQMIIRVVATREANGERAEDADYRMRMYVRRKSTSISFNAQNFKAYGGSSVGCLKRSAEDDS